MDPFEGLKFDLWGIGLAHMAATPDECPKCRNTGFAGDPSFPIPCSQCNSYTPVQPDAGHDA